MALAKRLPMSLRAGRARAQIVLEETEEQPSRVRRGAVGAGARPRKRSRVSAQTRRQSASSAAFWPSLWHRR